MKTSLISRSIPAALAALMISSVAVSAAPFGGGAFGGPGTHHGATPTHARGDFRQIDRTDRVEGRIAFLKAELKITDAQNAQWEPVAKAMRDQSAAMTKLREDFRATREAARTEAEKRKDQPLTAPEALARREQMSQMQAKAIAARTDGQKQFATAFNTLYDGLSAEQKKTADALLARGGHGRSAHHQHRR
jgi:hypothetical protein